MNKAHNKHIQSKKHRTQKYKDEQHRLQGTNTLSAREGKPFPTFKMPLLLPLFVVLLIAQYGKSPPGVRGCKILMQL